MRPLSRIIKHLRNEHGQGLVEYALILVLVSIVAVAALVYIGEGTNKNYSKAADNIKNVNK